MGIESKDSKSKERLPTVMRDSGYWVLVYFKMSKSKYAVVYAEYFTPVELMGVE